MERRETPTVLRRRVPDAIAIENRFCTSGPALRTLELVGSLCSHSVLRRSRVIQNYFAGEQGNCTSSLRSCAVKDSCQLIGMFSFAVEGAADRSEGLGERKNFARDQQIGILGADRMPVHTIRCYGDFRH